MQDRTPTAPPPSSETGVEMPTVGVGWLRGTLRADPETVFDALAPFFGRPTVRPGGTRWYAASASLIDRRVQVAWDGYGSAAGTTMVDVTQTALDHLGWQRSLDLAASLRELGFRPSRVDVYMDDRARLADPLDVHAALEAGQAVTHAQGYQLTTNSYGGATTYLGRRTSERFLRVYRKGHETADQADPRNRWELETKGLAAADVLLALTTTDQPAAAVVAAIVGFVDFRDRAGVQHGDRAPRLDWWTALVGTLARVKGAARQRIDTLARRALWVRTQVAPSLAVLVAAVGYGDVWLAELLHDGRRRAERFQWASS
jgi:DNA relaxase NicK